MSLMDDTQMLNDLFSAVSLQQGTGYIYTHTCDRTHIKIRIYNILTRS